MPKLSVLMPVYNGMDNYPVDLMKASIKSILALPIDLELIVIDDGSTDNTYDTLMFLWENQQSEKLRVIRLMKNRGQSVALNAGLDNAEGQYIWQWSVRATASPMATKLVEVLDNDPEIGFAYGKMYSYSGKKEYTHRPPHIFDKRRFANRYLCNFYMYRKLPELRYAPEIQLDNGRIIGVCDRDMVMQLLDKDMKGHGLHDTLCVNYFNGGRHTMHDVTEHREQIETVFNKQWGHLIDTN